MRPTEVAILENLLELLERVAQYSETARNTLFTNTEWKVTQSLFSLLCCPVKSPLALSNLLFPYIYFFNPSRFCPQPKEPFLRRSPPLR